MNDLFRPIDIASLVFFRILFGILGFVDVMSSYFYYHLQKDAFNPDHFQFRYYGFEWVSPLADPWMTLVLFLLMALALFIALGWRYRLSCTLFFLGFTYLFLLEKANYLNHGYLFCWISFIMIFLPANRAISLDVKYQRVRPLRAIAYWPLFLLQFLMGIVYFFGGIAKINEDWLRAMPLRMWLPRRGDAPLVGGLLEWPETAYFMSYGGVLFDLMVVPLLLFRQTRLLAFALAIFFHLTNALIFNIGIFPVLSIGLTALFFPPDFPRQLLAPFIQKWPRLLPSPVELETLPHQLYTKNRYLIQTSIVVIVLFHLLIPLRHHLFPGPVAWTEEGHRYSWRMMLRAKTGNGVFVIEHLDNGQKEKVKPRDFLSGKQEQKMYTHPDMILQFAHFLQKKYEAEGNKVAIYADIQVRLNDHPRQAFIDPTIDLTKVKWRAFYHSEWILPADF